MGWNGRDQKLHSQSLKFWGLCYSDQYISKVFIVRHTQGLFSAIVKELLAFLGWFATPAVLTTQQRKYFRSTVKNFISSSSILQKCLLNFFNNQINYQKCKAVGSLKFPRVTDRNFKEVDKIRMNFPLEKCNKNRKKVSNFAMSMFCTNSRVFWVIFHFIEKLRTKLLSSFLQIFNTCCFRRGKQ